MLDEPAGMLLGAGEWIRRRRKALDLTQDELARQVGCSKVTIRKIESEERRPSKQIAERLADVLGVAAEDRKAFIRFVRGDPRTALPARLPEGSQAVPWQTPQSNLPVAPTRLIGREVELAELHQRLLDPAIRLLTLFGPGGIGKTHLALESAEEAATSFSDGAYFVPLAPLTSHDFIVSAIANALKLSFYGALEPKDQLLNYLKNKQLLLMLDSIEHLMAGVYLLTDLLAGAPKIKLLVTSRERLNLRGEWLFEVTGLTVPESLQTAEAGGYDAVQLFAQCARRVRPEFSLSDSEKPAVIRICQLVEGLPLGIELAAAWVRALSCREIAAEIERNLEFLSTPKRDVSERHWSLKAVFEHSWRYLSEAERAIFQSLSVFRDGFEREGAETVAGASLPVLAALVDKSLIRYDAAGRYGMHDLLRQYAIEKLSEAGELQAVGTRHRDWCAALANQAIPPDLWGAAEAIWLKRLELERDNLRAALEWSMQNGEAEERLLFVDSLVWFWYVQAHYTEGRQWLQRALASSAGASPGARAAVLLSIGQLATPQGHLETAAQRLDEALGLFRGIDLIATGWALLHRGHVAILQGQYERGNALYAESASVFQSKNHRASVHLYQGMAACYQRDYDRARHLLEECLPILKEENDRLAVVQGLHGLAIVALNQDGIAKAATFIRESLTTAWAISAPLEIALCLEATAGMAVAQGQHEKAARLFGAAQAVREAINTPLQPGARADYDRDISALSAYLSDAAFEAAFKAGRDMTMEQAVLFALETRGNNPAVTS